MEQSDKKEVHGYYKTVREENPDYSCALAAVQATLMFMENNKMETVLEFDHRTGHCRQVLCDVESNHFSSSIRCGLDLFFRFITLTNMHFEDFDRCRKNMIHRAHHWVNKMVNAKKTIAAFAEPFIPDGTLVLTHSYSRVVMEMFRLAVQKGKVFKVYVTESQPDKSGYRTAKELREMGVSVTVVLDAAVSYIMEKVALVVVGAENIVKNGGILNKIGTYTIAMAASAYSRPLYVVAESLKFTELYTTQQADIPNPIKFKVEGEEEDETEEAHPCIDYTPPEYIGRLITDFGSLPPAAILDEVLSLYH